MWSKGIRAWKERITSSIDKPGVYARTATLEDLCNIYAPLSENDTVGYVATTEDVKARVKWSERPWEQSAMQKWIINYGHRDATGGGTMNPQQGNTERERTDDVGIAVRDAIRRSGGRAFVVQEMDGDADNTVLKKSLDWVGKTAVEIDRRYGPVNGYLSIHFEGSTSPGVFAIVPDSRGLLSYATKAPDPGDEWANNPLDEKFGERLANRVGVVTGLGLRQTNVVRTGLMSERQTAVGGAGWRLSEYHETLPIRRHAVRNILECGAMPVNWQNDIIMRDDFPGKVAGAVVSAIEEMFGPVGDESPAATFQVGGFFEEAGSPTEQALREWFGTVRAYNPDGPVSRVWREWCLANGAYPRLRSVEPQDEGGTLYWFSNDLLIRWDGARASIVKGV